ncbi:MAG: threonine--tRNA ligase [candidate division NC10 bacterium]|nr:threonine--tRNA ligase [candidate division NC10 bacterium]
MGNVEVILPDGRRTTWLPGRSAGELLRDADGRWTSSVIAARVDGRLVDLSSVPPAGATVEFVKADSPEGLKILRHSAAHLMAAAVQELFGEARFAIGPAIEEGFYYDIQLPRTLTPEDLPAIEAKMQELAEQDLPFIRLEVPLEEAIGIAKEMDQTYKVEILETIRAEGESQDLAEEADATKGLMSFYQMGKFLDLCRGPHVPSTLHLRAFKLTHVAGAYWRGDQRRPMLQRIYGTAFPTEEALAEHLFRLEEAKRRDHRRLGKELDLFTVSEEIGPGLILWLPKGALVRQRIEDFMREELKRLGYDVVYTPHVARSHLWEQSGHMSWYQENMFSGIEVEGQEYLVKPMNCPFHIMIYKSQTRSYRDLPMRLAEFGTVYRYERSGVLHGLLRVRGLTQDDAHLFCRPDQIQQEVAALIDLTFRVMRAFGFRELEIMLSVRDPGDMGKFAGRPEVWDQAEAGLAETLETLGLSYQRVRGEANFYGPKIDFHLFDAIGRKWQLTTIQLDYTLPERFDLTYMAEDGRFHRLVMIHRAILGSLERFFGILIEHYAGAFPTWLAPVQVMVIPVALRHHAFAQELHRRLREAGVRAEWDERSEKVGYKVRDAEVRKVPYVLVVGDRELQSCSVSVRARGGQDRGSMSLEEFLGAIREELSPPAA